MNRRSRLCPPKLRTALVAAALGLSAGAPAAMAQSQPSADDLAHAREEFRKGLALEAAGDWVRALETFRSVARVKSTPQVRFHIAACEEKTGDYVAALGSYRLALHEAREAKAADVERAAQDATSKLEPKIPKLTITRGEGAGVAQVRLDEESLGPASVGSAIRVNPGPHVVKATADGREPAKIELTLAEGENKTVELTLEPAKAAATSGAGDATPPTESHDGAPADTGGGSGMKIAGFVIGGLGIVSLGASAVFFAMRQSAISELDGQCGPDRQACPADAKSTFDRGKLDATLATGTFIGGIAALALGAGLVLAAPKSHAAPRSARAREGGAPLVRVTPIAAAVPRGAFVTGGVVESRF